MLTGVCWADSLLPQVQHDQFAIVCLSCNRWILRVCDLSELQSVGRWGAVVGLPDTDTLHYDFP